jgi:hypothetical protein
MDGRNTCQSQFLDQPVLVKPVSTRPLAWGLFAAMTSTPSLAQALPKWLFGLVMPFKSSASEGSRVSTKAFLWSQ